MNAGQKQRYRAAGAIAIKTQDKVLAKRLEAQFGVSPVAARVLAARGFGTDERTSHFLNPTLKAGLPDPGELKNLQPACELFSEIIRRGGGIAVCCDFDVDGLSGGSLLSHFLLQIGADAKAFVPDRFTEGYGLNPDMVRRIAAEGRKLLVTVDYGTSNSEELALARSLGMRTIVIDHHHVGSNAPGADVFINPQQDGCGFADKILSASGLAWYVAVGLKRLFPEIELDVRSYLDLACLGTICDMVPLIGANRVIAKRGLELVSCSKRPGLVALKEAIGARGEVTCSHVGFGIGPRINAAGRMSHGDMVIELLTTDNIHRANKIAAKLNRLNLERQDIEARMKEIATSFVETGPDLPWGITVFHEDFHTGVIGIVAQRLVERFYRPTVVMGKEGEIYKGSARGIKNFNVVEALRELGHLLTKFGGHEGAGGFSIKAENISYFVSEFNKLCLAKLKDIRTHPVIEADTEVCLDELSLELVDEFKSFAPFGIGNPGTQLLIDKLTVIEQKILKEAHLKVTLSDGKSQMTGLMWHTTHHPAISIGSKIRAVVRPSVNTFRGVHEVQVGIQAVEGV